MTLEETIAHHRWCADICEGEVRDEQLQMVAWLEELVRLKAENAKLKKAMDFQALELGCMTDNRDILHLENKKLRRLLSSALIVAGFKGRKYLDTYLREEEGTTLWQELKGLGIEVN